MRQQETSHLDVARDNLGTVLGYMTPYFPFRSGGSRDVKVNQHQGSKDVAENFLVHFGRRSNKLSMI